MSATPVRPDNDSQEVDEETRRMLDERLKTFDEDAKTAEPWDVVRERILRNLKQPAPR